MTKPATAATEDRSPWMAPVIVWLLGTFCLAQVLQTWLSSESLGTRFLSGPTWLAVATWLAGAPPEVTPQERLANIPLTPLLLIAGAVSVATWLAGGFAMASRRGISPSHTLREWAMRGWVWWCLLEVWDILRLVSLISEWLACAQILIAVTALWGATCLAGWMTTFLVLSRPPASETMTNAQRGAWSETFPVWIGIAIYTVVFVAMNWGLYFNLRTPHGDSAMYEEHLWNVLHGKGFRSYLDQGLFWGEHIQCIHLLLLPAYVLWPSHLLLEFCSSFALACGALPIYGMARRRCEQPGPAVLLACAYLLYFPMHYMDIEIDLKTFRPESFGIPLLLLTLDQVDRRHIGTTLLVASLCLLVKEDYSVILAPLGLWIAVTNWWEVRQIAAPEPVTSWLHAPRWRWFGVALCVGAVAYFLLATRVLIPYFRNWEDLHYARYFTKFGGSFGEIVVTMLTRPDKVLGELLTPSTVVFAAELLVPCGLIALCSPTRLLVGLPLFTVLSLNELAQSPTHQFHAPLVAIVFWAAAAGLGNLSLARNRGGHWTLGSWHSTHAHANKTAPRALDETAISSRQLTAAWFAACCAAATGLFYGFSPTSGHFWDPGSSGYWRKLYVMNERARMFAEVKPQIPDTACVASTDYVHPRFTHCKRSYDYSHYPRKVSNYERRVPTDTDFIVIDTRHPYSDYKKPEDVPEFHSPQWVLLPDRTDGYYIILRRKPAEAR